MAEHDPLRDLEDKRRSLTGRWLAYKTATRREGVQVGFWASVGAVAMAADMALLGGLGTALAAMSGAGFLAYRRESKRLEHELKELDHSISQFRREQDDYARRHPKPEKSLDDGFSPAAKRKIDGLQARLDDLEKSMEKLAGDKLPKKPDVDAADLGKPKYKPPQPPAF